jgi:hypothetical protein
MRSSRAWMHNAALGLRPLSRRGPVGGPERTDHIAAAAFDVNRCNAQYIQAPAATGSIATRPGRRCACGTSVGTGATGLEPATSGVTGRRSNQLSYAPRGVWPRPAVPVADLQYGTRIRRCQGPSDWRAANAGMEAGMYIGVGTLLLIIIIILLIVFVF